MAINTPPEAAEEFLHYLSFLTRRAQINLESGDDRALRYNLSNIMSALDGELNKYKPLD